MTDNEIKKALKEILETMLVMGDLQTSSTISKALALINHLQAKVEFLQMDNAQLQSDIVNANMDLIDIASSRLNECEDFIDKDTINRLQAENMVLKDDLDYFKKINAERNISALKGTIQTAKAEAYKECIEKVKGIATDIGVCDANGNNYGGASVVFVNDLDNLLKEKVGEDNVNTNK